MVLFTMLALVDLLVFERRPHDVLSASDPWSVAGVLLVLTGLAVRSWAAGTLRKVKELVTSGPYALVRNPLYVGSFLMMAGFSLLVGDWLTLMLVIGPMIALYWLAVRDEEKVLAKFFPSEWPVYSSQVPRFVPRLKVPTSEGWSIEQWRRNHEFNAWIGAALALGGLRVWWMVVG